MLVLTRRKGDTVRIGREIEVMVSSVKNGNVRLSIKAPPHLLIARGELLKAKEAAK